MKEFVLSVATRFLARSAAIRLAAWLGVCITFPANSKDGLEWTEENKKDVAMQMLAMLKQATGIFKAQCRIINALCPDNQLPLRDTMESIKVWVALADKDSKQTRAAAGANHLDHRMISLKQSVERLRVTNAAVYEQATALIYQLDLIWHLLSSCLDLRKDLVSGTCVTSFGLRAWQDSSTSFKTYHEMKVSHAEQTAQNERVGITAGGARR